MNRILLLLAAVLAAAAAAPAHAQFGIRGGVNLTRFVGQDAGNVEGRQGLKFGGSLHLFGVGPVSIVPEVYYTQKGAQVNEVDGGPQPERLDFSLEYFEVPVLAKLVLPIPGLRTLRPYLAAGPAFAWQLSCEVAPVGGGAAPGAQDCASPFGDARTAFRSADRGLVLSGGLDLGVLGVGAVNLDARLVRGLARLTEGEGRQPDVRNQAFSLMLGYTFGW